MKIKTLAFSLGLILSLAACSRENTDDGNGNNNGQPTGLAAYLDGRFNVTAIDFAGTVSAFNTITAPIDSSGNGGTGFYIFDATQKRADFDVIGRIKFSILGQTTDAPIPVEGGGDLEILSETRFTITEENGPPRVYDIIKAENNELVFTTRTRQDTMGLEFDITLEVFLEKD